MDAQKLKKNIDIIESLNISFYEKDLIKSAFYNHINNIPESKEAREILNKYFIVFRNGNIIFRNGNVMTAFAKKKEIEDRKKLYKQSIKSKQNDSIYSKNYTEIKVAPDAKSSAKILDYLANAQSIYKDTLGLLNNSENILNECFTKDELSFNMINNIITQTRTRADDSIKIISEFLESFLNFFDGLNDESKSELLQKADNFLATLQKQKDTSAKLCIQLSSIKAHNALKKSGEFMQYLESTINDLSGYMK